jgi:MoxR-like ATPase
MTDSLWPPGFPRQVTLSATGPTHVFDPRSAWAIVAAQGARRPLLVRGEPGTGKSQLARAAAVVLKRAFVQEVITSRSEAHDLHWRFDAVARLGRAQAMSVRGATRRNDILEESLYVSPGPLWWVFDWKGAEKQHRRAIAKGARPPKSHADSDPRNGCVLLIDEIDKADSDVPNGLLESLGNGEFHVPYFSEPVKCNPDLPPPLVVITTNEERELPPAFVRRCLVLQLALPAGTALEEFLVARGRAHFGTDVYDEVYKSAAKLVADDRPPLIAQGLVAPGQAEYLDLLRAVFEHGGRDEEKQKSILAQVKDFVLDKNPAGAR